LPKALVLDGSDEDDEDWPKAIWVMPKRPANNKLNPVKALLVFILVWFLQIYND
jgi:hypothetical protein